MALSLGVTPAYSIFFKQNVKSYSSKIFFSLPSAVGDHKVLTGQLLDLSISEVSSLHNMQRGKVRLGRVRIAIIVHLDRVQAMLERGLLVIDLTVGHVRIALVVMEATAHTRRTLQLLQLLDHQPHVLGRVAEQLEDLVEEDLENLRVHTGDHVDLAQDLQAPLVLVVARVPRLRVRVRVGVALAEAVGLLAAAADVDLLLEGLGGADYGAVGVDARGLALVRVAGAESVDFDAAGVVAGGAYALDEQVGAVLGLGLEGFADCGEDLVDLEGVVEGELLEDAEVGLEGDGRLVGDAVHDVEEVVLVGLVDQVADQIVHVNDY